MRITKEQAKEFLKEINQQDKVAVVCHDDLDGVASGILVYDYLNSKGFLKVDFFPVDLKADVLSGLNLQDKEVIIILDIGDDMIVNFIGNFIGKKILVVDHHPKKADFSDAVLEYNDFEEGYFPTSRAIYEILGTGEKQWLSVAGVLTDAGDLYKENLNFINEFLNEQNLTLEDFVNDVSDPLKYVLIYLKKDLKKAFELIKSLNSYEDVKNLEDFYSPIIDELDFFKDDFENNKEDFGDIWFYYFEPIFSIKMPLINYLARKNTDKILVFASPSGDEGFIGLSVRNSVGDLSASKVLNEGIMGLNDARFGGHKFASGGIILKEDLDIFRDNLKNIRKSE